MRKFTLNHFNPIFLVLITVMLFISCDQSSSPEGRMTLKLEELQQSMMDSLKQQNAAILDSLSAIRNELDEIKQEKK